MKIKDKRCGTRLYDIWRDMRHRCSCKGMKNYKDYGGRGIKVCEAWDKDYDAFKKWAYENGYDDTLTIDRIDVNGNYEPSNCRWADKSTQSANRRSRGKVEYIGVSKNSNGTVYTAFIEKNRKHIFTFSSPSKNECARKRNEFIINNSLNYPLNEIKEEYEDVLRHKKITKYYAISKDGTRICADTIRELCQKTNLSKSFICGCYSGRRNSREYTFEKEVF